MTTITTDHGTFEGETLELATAAAKKAARKEKARAKVRNKLHDQARQEGKAIAYDFLVRKLEDKEMPKGWRYYEAHTELGRKYGVRVDDERDSALWGTHRERLHIFATSAYGATYDLSGHRLVGSVMNGAGFHTALWLKDDSTGKVEGYAIGGAREGEEMLIVLVPLPLTPEDFAHLPKDE